MFGKKQPEVLVVGAGPVGLLAALLLAKHGVRVEIVDKEERRAGHSYALALHSQTLALFNTLDLLDKVLEQCYRVQTVGLYEGIERKAELQLSALRPEHAFIAVLQQNTFEGILEEALKEHDVKVQWNHRIDHLLLHDEHVSLAKNRLDMESLGYIIARTEKVVMKSYKMEVPFVIGADGHSSYVRKSVDIDFNTAGETQHYAVFEFKTDYDLQNEMRLDFFDNTANVLWPMPDGYCRWSFQLLDYEASEASRKKDRFELQIGAEKIPMLDEDHLYEFLAERAPWFEGSIDEIRWRLLVRFERRLASAFGKGRVWLAGDAAHLTGPAGIQSMNVGLREAKDLADNIALILQKGETFELLEEYNRERLAEWRYMLGLKGGLTVGKQTDSWIGKHSEQLLSCIPASSGDLAKLAEQIGLKA
ncbi:MAG: FAD-dependent oxidoreductase [bacterium]